MQAIPKKEQDAINRLAAAVAPTPRSVNATLLTLLFLPALYVAWYKIREPKQEQQEERS